MGLVVPKPFGRFRQYRKSIGLEVQDPNRLLVEDLAGGREEVIGRFGAVVVDVSIDALGAVHGKAAIVGAGVGDLVAHILLRDGKEGGETVLVEFNINSAVGAGAQSIGSSVIFESQVGDLRHIVYILDEADRLINDLETVGGAAASNLRAVLQSDTPFHLLICGANGLTEYYLRGGSMTQLFECTYGRPMIIGQMAKEEWRTATSSLIDTVDLESNFRALDQLWFYTRGLIHPAYLLMDTCFTYLDNFPSVQPAPNGKTTLYAARVLEATNAMLCSSPQQLHMDKLIDSLSDDSNDLWRSVLTCLMRECTIPYQWVPVTVLESIVDESAGITWDKISNVLSNLVSYRGLLEYSARRRSYRPQCELYRQILRNKLLPDCKLQPYPYFKPRKEGH